MPQGWTRVEEPVAATPARSESAQRMASAPDAQTGWTRVDESAGRARVTQPQPSAPRQSETDPLGYLAQMVRNIPVSGLQAGKDLLSAAAVIGNLVGELTPAGMTRRLMDGGESRLLPALTQLPGALIDRYRSRYGTAEARERTVRDDPVGMVGDMYAIVAGANTAGQALNAARRGVAGKTPFANPNAVERDAVAFGQREGIPVDAGTATGNRFVRGVQRMADESLGGSIVADRSRQAQAQAFSTTGERLANRIYPTPVTPEQAGTAIQAAVTGHVTASHQAATNAYATLRALEQRAIQAMTQHGGAQAPPGAARPFTAVPLAVDVQAAKQALQPIYDDLLRESQLGIPMQGGKGRALKALDGLMNGPDQASLSAVDAALGDLKALARGADLPALRTPGQGTAAAAVQTLDAEVRAAARRGGPDVLDALMRGRLATRAKYGAAGVLEQLRTEPVQVFNQATWQKDAGIAKLRDVAKLAPNEMAQVGRAYLEDLLGKATAKGGFDGVDGIWAQWQKLGPHTKQLLFKGQTPNLDRFFLLAKKAAENPNPSGTALTVFKGGEGLSWFLTPAPGLTYSMTGLALAKILRTPAAVRLLSKGLSAPSRPRAVDAAHVAAIARVAGVELRPVAMPVPALAGDEGPAGRPDIGGR